MKHEDKVTSQPLAKQIAEAAKEKGVELPESYWDWVLSTKDEKYKIVSVSHGIGTDYWAMGRDGAKKDIRLHNHRTVKKGFGRMFHAYDVAELGEILPKGYMSFRDSVGKYFCEDLDTFIEPGYKANNYKTEAEARGKMLLYLIKNNLFNNAKDTDKKPN